jgi:hypothetical protein
MCQDTGGMITPLLLGIGRVGDTRGGYGRRLLRARVVEIKKIIGVPGTKYRPRYGVGLTERASEL